MRPCLAPGYLRCDVESDKLIWSDRSLNIEQLYKANQCVLKRDPITATRYFNLVLEPEDFDERLLYWCSLARLHALTRNADDEALAMQHAHAVADTCSDQIRACYEMRSAVWFRARHCTTESLEHALRAGSSAQQSSNVVVQGFAASEIGLTMLRLGNNTGALKHFLEAYRLLQDQLLPQQLATLVIALASAHARLFEYEKAIELLGHIIALGSTEIGVRNHVVAKIMNATAEHSSSNLDDAIRHYEELLTEYSTELDNDQLVQILGSVGDAYCSANKLTQAQQILSTNSALINRASPPARQTILGTMGKIHARLGNMESARACFDESLCLVREINSSEQHRLLLEDYIHSGCIASAETMAQAYEELVGVVSRQLHEQSTTIVTTKHVHAIEIQTSMSLARKRQSEILQLLGEVQQKAAGYIGSHLHATTLQELAVLHFRLESLRGNIQTSKEHDGLSEKITGIQEHLRQITAQLRDLSHVLHQREITGSTVCQRIDDYAMYIGQYSSSVVVSHTSGINTLLISDEQAMIIYRSVQICVQNSIQHSACDNIDIAISSSDKTIDVSISDNGSGFDETTATHGIGLRELHALAHHAGGSVSIRSTQDHGTCITTTFPVHQAMKHTGQPHLHVQSAS